MRINNMAGPMIVEKGIVAGNVTDKYGSQNPLYQRLMRRFCTSIIELTGSINPNDIHEVGCGEGHLCRLLDQPGRKIRASDFSAQIIAMAKELTGETKGQIEYHVRSLYDLSEDDAAECMLCCEVLEHLDDPEAALEKLSQLARPYLLVSVPREPIWRVLNVARGKYLRDGGNTPGHLNHWSSAGFIKFLSTRFEVIDVRLPFPWTMVLCKTKS